MNHISLNYDAISIKYIIALHTIRKKKVANYMLCF